MNMSAQFHPIPISNLLRWSGRAAGIVLLLSWLALVLFEAARGFGLPPLSTYYQAAALAVIFAGYAVGWQYELFGGLLAVAGTVAFFIVGTLTLGTPPSPAVIWFATPGVLYLLAWNYSEHRASA